MASDGIEDVIAKYVREVDRLVLLSPASDVSDGPWETYADAVDSAAAGSWSPEWLRPPSPASEAGGSAASTTACTRRQSDDWQADLEDSWDDGFMLPPPSIGLDLSDF